MEKPIVVLKMVNVPYEVCTEKIIYVDRLVEVPVEVIKLEQFETIVQVP